MNSARILIEKILINLFKFAPFAIILGLFDYRFHSYFWPEWNIFHFFPFFHKQFDFFSILDLYLLILFALYAIYLFIKRKSPFAVVKKIWFPFITIICGIAIARIFFVPILPQIKSFWWQIFTNFLSPMLFSVICIDLLREEKIRLKFFKNLCFSFLILGSLCIFEYVTNWLPGTNRDFLGRLVWPYIDPFVGMKAESANWLAYIFGPASLFAFYLSIEKKRWIEIVTFAVSFSVLLLTKSYAGILAFLIGICALTILRFRSKIRITIIVILLILVGLGIGTQYNSRKFQILLGNYSKENSLQRRIQIYQFTEKAFLENPIQGIGPGNFQSYFRQNMSNFIGKPIPEEEIPPHPHNLLAFFWSDLGIFGLFAGLYFYATTLKRFFLHKSGKAFAIVFSYFLLHGLVDLPYGLEEISLLFWIFFSLMLLSHNNENK